MSPDEIKKFCNVHALLFTSSLAKDVAQEENPSHPVYLFKLENREIEKLTAHIKEWVAKAGETDVDTVKAKMKELLLKLRDIERHYTRKEQLLFPYLEKYGFMGPSKVMWGKDNEIRDLYKHGVAEIENVRDRKALENFIDTIISPLVEEVDGMIFKEENILFPTSLEKLSMDDWVDILKESDQVGYAFIEQPAETSHLVENLKRSVIEEAVWKENAVVLPSGVLFLSQLMHIMNSLPVELTFIDQDDTVRYFTENRERIFVRTRSVIGRKVQNCHPPQSVDRVEHILKAFKEGSRDRADFWINLQGRFIYIVFFAVRDQSGNYLGTLEVTQDITELRALKGERRLIDEETGSE